MKKRILPLLAALALLAGCTGKTSPSGTPTPTPAPAVSSAPAPTPAASGAPGDQGLVWGENFGMEDIDVDSLPTQTAAAPDLWTERLSLVGAVPEADISLYGLNGELTPWDGLLLRRGKGRLLPTLPAEALMIVGYWVFDGILTGSLLGAAVGIPSNLMQAAFGIAAFWLLSAALGRSSAMQKEFPAIQR